MTIRGLYTIAEDEEIAHQLLKGGARIIQLRDKRRVRFWEKAKQIASFKKEFSFLFIVNDDVAAAAEFGDGVHVGADDPSIEECRKILGPSKLIGYSSHSLEEAIEAERRGADYVAFGAIFPSPSKGPGHPVQGIERLKEVVDRLKIPVVAIGGIDRSNVVSVIRTGVDACAMISALTGGRQTSSVAEETGYFANLL